MFCPGGKLNKVTCAVAALSLLVLPLVTVAQAGPAAAAEAPGAPGGSSTWTTGAKQGMGTSTTTASKVWYTLSEGTLSEVYYPRVDTAGTKGLQMVVSDGRTFTDIESSDTTHAVRLADPTSLTYRQTNTDKDGRYRVVKTYVTDPDRSTVLVDVELQSLDGGTYTAYVLYDPSLDNSGKHDSGSSVGSALVAEDLRSASALVAKPAFRRTTSGFDGASDGLTDLRADNVLDNLYLSAVDGNVVQVGELATTVSSEKSHTTLALGFGKDGKEAVKTANASLGRAFPAVAQTYQKGWSAYLGSLDPAPKSVKGAMRTQYDVALMTLKSHEDKTYRGANIASLTVPWGQAINADEEGVGGYHLVWARDLYQVATAQLAAGDKAAAERSLDYLFDVQQRPNGSFPQNTLLDGTPYWGSLQLDEVAFPIVLAGQLGRQDATTWGHVKKAADFIVANGPSTPQERWEEEGGYSPSTLAAEIAGLTTAADIARRNGDAASAALYAGVADQWQRKVKDWTFTTTGPLGDGHYFTRVDDNGNPDDGHTIEINNGGGTHDERAIVDGGFLDLVRLGVLPADDPQVRASLPEVDSTVKVETPNGPMWYRYNEDGYGEKADGSAYDGTGVGRLWPLLTGERGEYELASGRSASSHLKTMANAANDGFMIPEQVWDKPAAHGFEFGEGTGSATPLAWSMAQFVRLALSIDGGRPVETPKLVADRYANGDLVAGPSLDVSEPADNTTTDQATSHVVGTTSAGTVYVNAGGKTTEVNPAGGAFEATAALGLGKNTITIVAIGADGGTSMVQRTITSTNFGTKVGSLDDPSGDDNGPGSYVYPASDAFSPGAFDVTRFGVYDDGTNANFVLTLGGDVRNPWGGNQMSVQRFNVYLRSGSGAGAVDALPGTNAKLAAPYDKVVTADGFNDLGVKDAAGNVVGSASLLALGATKQIVVSVPKDVFGTADLSSAEYAVVMMSHAGDGEGSGHVRPVYDKAYWDSTVGTGDSWIHDYRFGGGAGVFDGSAESRDTDIRDPNVLDLLVPAGGDQGQVLDWTRGAPVTLPYVSLG